MINIVEIENLGKKYIVSHEKEAMVRHILPKFLGIKKYEEFWALRDINLELEKGSCLGIIGRNGAGKSTLLNILAGITFPTQGSIKVSGKVSAILSLGVGFHPELTGEENIYLNASILGLGSREIKKRFKEIIDFSELKDFIDLPLKRYSTGMYLRLGFSVAVHVDFDILLIDEVLTVGDIAFQQKCKEKLNIFKELKKTVVLVTQSLDLLNEFCDRVVLLEKGSILWEGQPEKAIKKYEELVFS